MQKNIKKFVTIGVCFLFVVIMLGLLVTAEQSDVTEASLYQQTELDARFIGALRGGLLPTVGYSIYNSGNEIARNITATFTIKGGLADDIHLFDSLEKTELGPGTSVVKSGVFALQGFGPLTVTLTVDAEDSESIHRTAMGFQVGFRTFIFG